MKSIWLLLIYMIPVYSYHHFHPTSIPIHEIPLCKNCEYCALDTETCSLFGKIDIITGNIYYQNCKITRNNESQCGIQGSFFFRRLPFNQ